MEPKLNTLEYLTKINNLIKEYTQKGANLSFEANDVRKTFWIKISNVLRCFYLNIDTIYITHIFNGRISGNFKNEEIEPIQNLGWNLDQQWQKEYQNYSKRCCLVNIWSFFEETLVEIYEKITPDKEKGEVKTKSNESNIIKRKLDKLLAELKKSYKGRDLKQDIGFIDLMRACRNACMHQNSVSNITGVYKTRIGEYKLSKDEEIDFLDFETLLVFIKEICGIIEHLQQIVNYKGAIKDKYISRISKTA